MVFQRSALLPISALGFARQPTIQTFSRPKRGSAPASGKLAFAPKKILSVRDYCLEITYEQGRDYTVDENGVISGLF